MMPVIRITLGTYERLQRHARPFDDKPDDVVNLALDALEEKLGVKAGPLAREPAPTNERKMSDGKKLPQKQFRAPLIETLQQLGGGAHVSKIREIMEQKVEPALGEADLEPVTNGDPRWWNAVCWERDAMVKEGILAKGSARGHWELSPYIRATPAELDRMTLPEFEKWIAANATEEKPDFRRVTFGHPTAVVDDLPVMVDKMLENLKVSHSGLVALMRAGALVRPRRTTAGDAEWKRSELMTALAHQELLS